MSVFSRDENLIGWIRSGEEANIPALTDELARLSRENADLRDIINRQSVTEEKFNGLSFEDLKAILEKDKLLRFLQGSRLNLINGITISEIPPPENAKPTTDRLLSLGLLETTGFIRTATNLPVLKLSSVGISFLNKLEALNDHLS